ncbi:glycosyltransferase family 4 protein [Flexithrix dorotheae]|uniref:glycosyltransferase family 4 protein n=1 Tax=Flexithrix dorotheae TaxID=70993 RepID=UPI000364544B|nr:glycosyltransferase family 1 protein [Flexithrix dorotheae]
MKVTFISCLTKNCGIGRYTDELTNAIHNRGIDVTLFRKDGGDLNYIKNYPYRSFKWLRHYVAPYYLSKAIKSSKSTIFHADYVDALTAYRWSGKKKSGAVVTTAHDAIPFKFPGGNLEMKYYRYHVNNATRISDKIIVVSEKSKEDYVYYTRINPDKVEVVYNGINHSFFYPDAVKKRNKVFTIRYIGGLGTNHKNAQALIEIARILESRNIEFQLQIGSGNAHLTPLPKLAEQYRLKNVKFVGFVPDQEVRQFLAEAELFLFPSLYEGFGFPPLEAMACGTAALSSKAGSLEEVLGNGAITVDPNPEAFATEIERLINDSKALNLLRENGLRQAQNYTWEKACTETLNIYNKLN